MKKSDNWLLTTSKLCEEDRYNILFEGAISKKVTARTVKTQKVLL